MECSVPRGGSPVIVIGMHRSGTSLVAQILREMGVHMGDPLDINHESVCMKSINRELLSAQGAHWARPEPFLSQLNHESFVKENARLTRSLFDQRIESYGQLEKGRLWGWKDPRNTLTLPLWLELFPHAKVIHVVRNGIDVAFSLHRREIRRAFRLFLGRLDEVLMFPPTFIAGYRLWQKYVLLGMGLETRCSNWLPLRYEEVVSQAQAQTAALAKFLSVQVRPEVAGNIASRIVRQQKERSTFDQLRVRWLLRMRLLDPRPLKVLGYEVPM